MDELNSDKRNQQRQINKLESRIDALEEEAKKRQILAANGSTKRIKISLGIKGDLFVLDNYIVNYIALYLPPANLVIIGRTCGRFGLIRNGQQKLLANEAGRGIFASTATEYEINALLPYNNESKITLLCQLYFLRKPLEFRQLIGKHINSTSQPSLGQQGKHYAIFNISREVGVFNKIEVGIVILRIVRIGSEQVGFF